MWKLGKCSCHPDQPPVLAQCGICPRSSRWYHMLLRSGFDMLHALHCRCMQEVSAEGMCRLVWTARPPASQVNRNQPAVCQT